MAFIMHGFVFVPAVVFGIVAFGCWGFCAVLDRRAAPPGAPQLASLQTGRRGFRPVVIQGGLAAGAMSSFRVPQTPLGSTGTAVRNDRAARSYGG